MKPIGGSFRRVDVMKIEKHKQNNKTMNAIVFALCTNIDMS